MGTGRLEAFSDAVFAIVITITVLAMKPPAGTSILDLRPEVPIFLTYVLSFTYLGIYWNNHHHMLQVVDHVTGGILWANLGLLFWLSLIPFVTEWTGGSAFAPAPTAVYGVVLLFASVSYGILQLVIIASQGEGSLLARAIGRDIKGKLSPILYAAAVPIAFFAPLVAFGLYVAVAIMWLVPDRRIERVLAERPGP